MVREFLQTSGTEQMPTKRKKKFNFIVIQDHTGAIIMKYISINSYDSLLKGTNLQWWTWQMVSDCQHCHSSMLARWCHLPKAPMCQLQIQRQTDPYFHCGPLGFMIPLFWTGHILMHARLNNSRCWQWRIKSNVIYSTDNLKVEGFWSCPPLLGVDSAHAPCITHIDECLKTSVHHVCDLVYLLSCVQLSCVLLFRPPCTR